MKKYCVIIALSALAMSAVVSCKKKSDPSRASLLIGAQWRLTKLVIDSNKNQVEETTDPERTDTSLRWQFNSDGSSTTTRLGITQGFAAWQLTHGDTYLELVDTTGGSTDTAGLQILTLTSTSLVLKDTSGISTLGIEWAHFSR